ncbi:MAG: hypothetical protein U5L96_07910 [Owenweeksia sp.]|nr:hypothetical protein [Owenweeksia sp.]
MTHTLTTASRKGAIAATVFAMPEKGYWKNVVYGLHEGYNGADIIEAFQKDTQLHL